MGVAGTFPEIVSLDVTTGIELEPTRGWVLAPAMGLDMVMMCDEGVLESNEELDEQGEESIWGLGGI